MKIQVLAGVLLALAAGKAFAESVSATCKNGAIVRRVELAPGEAPGGCSVAYFKETENPGVTQVLWSAKSGTDFCKEKAEGFVQKLSGMGWSCSGSLAGSSSETSTEAPAGASAP